MLEVEETTRDVLAEWDRLGWDRCGINGPAWLLLRADFTPRSEYPGVSSQWQATCVIVL